MSTFISTFFLDKQEKFLDDVDKSEVEYISTKEQISKYRLLCLTTSLEFEN